jgi:adenylosuccinate lyase
VYPERMLRNLESSFGLTFSGRVLLALVEAGLTRERAYELVQRNAMRAWDEEVPLADLLSADGDVTAVLSQDVLARAFDLEDALRHADVAFGRLESRLAEASARA